MERAESNEDSALFIRPIKADLKRNRIGFYRTHTVYHTGLLVFIQRWCVVIPQFCLPQLS